MAFVEDEDVSTIHVPVIGDDLNASLQLMAEDLYQPGQSMVTIYNHSNTENYDRTLGLCYSFFIHINTQSMS